MSVELEPAELGFKRPFQKEVSQTLRLRNPHSDPVAFKVKTTAPKQYCVRPNSGRIEAGGEVEVQVLLQAMKEDPPMDAKCRDKFLVQSVAVTAENELGNVAAVWQRIEQTAAKSAIQEKKIRVVFLPSTGETSTPAKVNGLGPETSASSQRSPSPEMVTPQKHSTTTSAGSVSRPDSQLMDNRSLDETVKSAHDSSAGDAQPMVASAVSGITNAMPSSAEQLKSQLAEAKNKILRLEKQAGEQGLRQRKTEAVNQDSKERITAGTTGMGVQQSPAGGVPVQIVAALCLLSFLLAYFFF